MLKTKKTLIFIAAWIVFPIVGKAQTKPATLSNQLEQPVSGTTRMENVPTAQVASYPKEVSITKKPLRTGSEAPVRAQRTPKKSETAVSNAPLSKGDLK